MLGLVAQVWFPKIEEDSHRMASIWTWLILQTESLQWGSQPKDAKVDARLDVRIGFGLPCAMD